MKGKERKRKVRKGKFWMMLKVVIAITPCICFLGTCVKNLGKIIFHSLLHKKEHFYMLVLCTINFFKKKFGGSIWCQQLIYP